MSINYHITENRLVCGAWEINKKIEEFFSDTNLDFTITEFEHLEHMKERNKVSSLFRPVSQWPSNKAIQ